MEDREAAENEKAEANIEPTEDKNQLFVPGADGNTDSKHSKSKYKPNKNRDNSASIPLLMSNFVENTSLRTLMRTSEPNANNDVKLQQDETKNFNLSNRLCWKCFAPVSLYYWYNCKNTHGSTILLH